MALAALEDALRITGRDIAEARVVISGAGAAGVAVARILLAAGRRRTSRSPTGAACCTPAAAT